MKRRTVLLAAGGIAVAAIVAVAGIRAARMTSRQVPPGVASTVPIDATAAAERLAGAIRFPTVSWNDLSKRDVAAFDGIIRYLADNFPRTHANLAHEVVGGHSLLFTWRGSRPDLPPAILTSHFDVVPVEAGTEARWSHPPFSGAIADGSVWGRGAIDDKAGVIGLLEATEALLTSGFVPSHTIYLAFGHNEEGGGDESGARAMAALLEARGVRSAFLLDEGGIIYDRVPGMREPVALIGITEKRQLAIELRARGIGGHASMPPSETASGILARAIERIEHSPMPTRLDGAVRQAFDTLTPELSFGTRMFVALADSWLLRPMLRAAIAAKPETNALIRTTIATTMLEASQKDNVLPSIAKATLNVRLLPGDTPEMVEAHLKNVIRDDRVEIARRYGPLPEFGAASTDTAGFGMLSRAIRAVYPQTLVSPYLTIAATDSLHYARVASNLYRFLPIYQDGAIESVHGTNEHVRIDAYERAVRIYATLLQSLGTGR